MSFSEAHKMHESAMFARREVFAEKTLHRLLASTDISVSEDLSAALRFEIMESMSAFSDEDGKSREAHLTDALVESRAREIWLLRLLDGASAMKRAVHSERGIDASGVESLYLDMRSAITGLNWHQIEHDGRWSGPGARSILQIPALGAGRWQIKLHLLGEVEAGLVDSMSLSVNGSRGSLLRSNRGFPCILSCSLEVPQTYRFPFWKLQFDFVSCRSPSQLGGNDDRILAVKFSALSICS